MVGNGNDDGAPPRERSGWRILGVVGVTASLLVVVLLAAARPEPGGAAVATSGLVLVAGVAALVALTGTSADRAVWLATTGLVCVIAGSGIGRTREEVFQGGGARDGHGGDVVAQLDTWWPLVGLGAALVTGAVVWVLARQALDDRSHPGLATGSLAVLAAGTVGITVALAELVVGEWLA